MEVEATEKSTVGEPVKAEIKFEQYSDYYDAERAAMDIYDERYAAPAEPKYGGDPADVDYAPQVVKHGKGRMWPEVDKGGERYGNQWQNEVATELHMVIGDDAYEMSISLKELLRLRSEIEAAIAVANAINAHRATFAAEYKAWKDEFNAHSKARAAFAKEQKKLWVEWDNARPKAAEPDYDDDDDYDDDEDDE